jgi:hypothetical protein
MWCRRVRRAERKTGMPETGGTAVTGAGAAVPAALLLLHSFSFVI